MRRAGAIDIGGTGTKIGIVAEDGSVVARTTIPTGADSEPWLLVDRIVTTLRPMLDAVPADANAVLGIGVSVAGFLDPEHATMFGNANLPSLCGFPLHRTLEERLALDCRLEVDSNAAVVAEYRHGAGRGSERLIFPRSALEGYRLGDRPRPQTRDPRRAPCGTPASTNTGSSAC